MVKIWLDFGLKFDYIITTNSNIFTRFSTLFFYPDFPFHAEPRQFIQKSQDLLLQVISEYDY